MSISASIDIKLVEKKHSTLTCLTVLKVLLNKSWTVGEQGEITYLPLGDDGDYDWTSKKMDIDAFTEIVSTKSKNDETVGVVLYHGSTSVGVDFLYFGQGKLSLNLTINKVYYTASDTKKFIDANWYFSELLEPLSECFTIESFSIEQQGC